MFSGSPQLLIEDSITPLKRQLYFTTAHAHFKAGCPALALEVLSKLPSKVMDANGEDSPSKCNRIYISLLSKHAKQGCGCAMQWLSIEEGNFLSVFKTLFCTFYYLLQQFLLVRWSTYSTFSYFLITQVEWFVAVKLLFWTGMSIGMLVHIILLNQSMLPFVLVDRVICSWLMQPPLTLSCLVLGSGLCNQYISGSFFLQNRYVGYFTCSHGKF